MTKGSAAEVQMTSGTYSKAGAHDVQAATDSPGGGGGTPGVTTDQGTAEGNASSAPSPSTSDRASGEVEGAGSGADGSLTAPNLGVVATAAARAQALSPAATSQSASTGTAGADDGSSLDDVAKADPIEVTTPDGRGAEFVTTPAAGASSGSDASGPGAGSSDMTIPASVVPAGLPRSISVQSAPGDGSAMLATAGESTPAPDESGIGRALLTGRQTVPISSHLVRNPPTRSDAEGMVEETTEFEGPAPFARGSDLLTNFLPFDRASLEKAIDRFLVEFEKIGEDLTGAVPTTHVVPALAAITISALAIEITRRKRFANGASRPSAHDEEDLARSSAYPTHWRLVVV